MSTRPSQSPSIDLVLDPTHRVVDLVKEEVDLGIRYGAGSWRGVDGVKLADAELIVVCAPSLLRRQAEMEQTVQSLRRKARGGTARAKS